MRANNQNTYPTISIFFTTDSLLNIPIYKSLNKTYLNLSPSITSFDILPLIAKRNGRRHNKTLKRNL